MPTIVRQITAVLFGSSIGLTALQSANAQSVEQFYKGKTVTILVGTSPGGINDITARFVARHLSQFIPGNPAIVVQQTPGGGGLVTANRIYQTSDRDGTVLAKLERATPQLAVQGNLHVQFDPLKLIWLGSMSSYAEDAYLMLVNADNPAKSVDEAGRTAEDHAGRQQCRIQQPDLRHYCQRGTASQCERRARLYRRGSPVPGNAAQGT